ncbi:MAG: hypothetical protein RMM17_03070 [Acidobacteriota bacterium]|nr:hypothetical protein [Blastocatellia bacterium]MDW8411650.1 hypothetical protein [Acidobacteriota bacterium]
MSDWSRYKSSAEEVLGQLRKLRSYKIDDKQSVEHFLKYLLDAEASVNRFLALTESYADKKSRSYIAATLDDIVVIRRLLDKRNDATSKLFRRQDPALFEEVKKRYALGSTLVLAGEEYYFLDSVLHEAWKSALVSVFKAEKMLSEEHFEQVKSKRPARK